jgi:hypothetical protein
MPHQHGGEDPRAQDARIFVDNVEEMVARARPDQPVPPLGRIDGTDRSGTVHCVVDDDGEFVDISIDPRWWGAVGPAGIAAAILDALSFARSKASMAQLILDRHGRRRAPGPGSLFAPEPSPPLPDPGSPDFEDALEAKIQRGYAILDGVERLNRERDTPARRVLTGPYGLFRLTMVGPQVEDAEVDRHGLTPGDQDRLAADARAVLREAARAARPVGVPGLIR